MLVFTFLQTQKTLTRNRFCKYLRILAFCDMIHVSSYQKLTSCLQIQGGAKVMFYNIFMSSMITNDFIYSFCL